MRIRSIKPEFWRSDDIDVLDWPTRLIFIGLWSYVDDNGVGIDKLSTITADLFAYDLSIDPMETLNRVSLSLNVLHSANMIARYRSGGKEYLHITNWEKHQRVNNPNKPRWPLPTSGDAEHGTALPRTDVEPIETLSPGAVEQRSSGAEEQGKVKTSATATPLPVEDDRFDEFWELYPLRKGKKPAHAKWKLAIKTTPADVILAAVPVYVAECARTDTFLKHPATWLHQEGWTDEEAPVMAPSQRPSGMDLRRAEGAATLVEMEKYAGMTARDKAIAIAFPENHPHQGELL